MERAKADGLKAHRPIIARQASLDSKEIAQLINLPDEIRAPLKDTNGVSTGRGRR
jgi:hypothetical protein